MTKIEFNNTAGSIVKDEQYFIKFNSRKHIKEGKKKSKKSLKRSIGMKDNKHIDGDKNDHTLSLGNPEQIEVNLLTARMTNEESKLHDNDNSMIFNQTERNI